MTTGEPIAWRRGFTTIELLIVMAILGILAAAVMPLGETLVTAQKERDLRSALREIRSALDEYKRATERDPVTALASGSGYPPTLKALVDGVPDTRAKSGGAMLYFLRAIPRDPFAAAQLPAEQTWRLRSFASTPTNPEPGADVYDVHSSSVAKALDGSLYAKW
jgi:general secretion pathway protein G